MNQMEQIETGATPIAELESRKGELKELMSQGLWKNNPSLVQVLGLCPTLAVSSTFTNALGLGLATMAVLVCSNLAVSLVRNWVPKDIRIPVYVMIIASLVTSVQLLMNAYTYGLYQALGIFIALIVVLLSRAWLEVTSGKLLGTEFILDKFMGLKSPAAFIGSSVLKCDIALTDPEVEPQHAQLKGADTHFVLEDRSLKKGTFVNDRRIQTCRLANRDRIRVGDTELTYHERR